MHDNKNERSAAFLISSRDFVMLYPHVLPPRIIIHEGKTKRDRTFVGE